MDVPQWLAAMISIFSVEEDQVWNGARRSKTTPNNI